MEAQAILINHEAVLAAISPDMAIERVRDGFIRYAKKEWSMPAKVYLENPPHGDFRAMPALGDDIAMVKWVTSFPANAGTRWPTVIGTILVNDATTGRPLAIIDGRAVTALRTGAAAAIASQALERDGSESVGVIGCGLHGRWAALCLAAAGYDTGVCADRNVAAARRLADELGWRAGTIDEALSCDVIALVTPGAEPVVGSSDLRPGMHINALGADGPGKAEIEVEAVTLCSIYCDEWTQASHGGEITGAVRAGLVTREDVTEIGALLTGAAPGRTSDDEVTLFDSTGLAVQDLAIVKALLEEHEAGRLEPEHITL